jgi:hypothetical protein
MKNRVIFLRICYWIGILIDGYAAVQLIVLRYWQLPKSIGMADASGVLTGAIGAAGQSAALMLGWTFLLLWADRKPVERKSVLLLTVCPVLFGLIINSTGIILTYSSFQGQAVRLIIQIVLTLLFSFGYFYAGKNEPARA